MANLPETSTFDAGVYQLETTDPALGGASGKANAGAINLTNRTKYLKDHVDLMEVIVTQGEAETGTATILRGWTAQRVRQAIAAAITAIVVQATETVKGIAEIATQVETNAGSSDITIVTPLKLRAGFDISLGVNGYIALPTWMSGLILQWGGVNTSSGADVAITFPLAFPTNGYRIVGTYNGTDAHNAYFAVLGALTATGAVASIFNTSAARVNTVSISYIAIGK